MNRKLLLATLVACGTYINASGSVLDKPTTQTVLDAEIGAARDVNPFEGKSPLQAKSSTFAPSSTTPKFIFDYMMTDRINLDLVESLNASTIFGDSIDNRTGSLSFQNTDYSSPGNFAIPVELRRTFKGGSHSYGASLEFGDWALGIPRITSSMLAGTNGFSGSWGYGNACSGPIDVDAFAAGAIYFSWEFWSGDFLEIPGSGSMRLLEGSGRRTRENWKVNCVAPGAKPYESFLVTAPNGVKYTFNQLRTYKHKQDYKAGKLVWIYRAEMLPTRIEDRFGNYVIYNYDASNRLTTISSSDGRGLTLYYDNSSQPHLITRATIDAQTWTFGYDSSATHLVSVTRPDGKSWGYDLAKLSPFSNTTPATTISAQCTDAVNTDIVSVTHPNGAIARYTLRKGATKRAKVVRAQALVDNGGGSSMIDINTLCMPSQKVIQKRVEIAAQAPLDWLFQYGGTSGYWSTSPTPSNPADSVGGITYTGEEGFVPGDLNSTLITNPDGSKQLMLFSSRYDWTEGLLISNQAFDTNGSTRLGKSNTQYQNLGWVSAYASMANDNNAAHEIRREPIKNIIVQYGQGTETSFFTELSDYNAYDLPQLVKEYNSYDNNRKWTKLAYTHDTTAWILNLPTSTAVSGDGINFSTVSETQHYPMASAYKLLPQYDKHYGTIVKTYESYHADGNPRRVSLSAPNRWQQLDNYKRGIAQLVTMPNRDNASLTVTATIAVNNDGTIARTTDFNGNCTDFGYDALKRVTQINPCDARWFDTVIDYQDASDGSPQQKITRGNYEKVTKFDALLRPQLVSERDITDANSLRYLRSSFDFANNPVFKSFASTNANETNGELFSYDGVQRNLSVCSTVDGSCVRTRYLPGNAVEVTNARGHITTTQFLAYGSPELARPLNIFSPESVTTSLGYNLYGNTTSITQGGITETRLYDPHQNLCKVIRPETAQSLFNSNVLGEVQWSIEGFNGSATNCESTASATNKASFAYDNWGSIKTIDYADTTPDVWYGRDAQGNVLFAKTGPLISGTISNPVTQWSYTYNSLNVIETETLSVDGFTFTVNPEYNALGQVNNLTYPSGLNISTNPNALGLPRSAGSYASNANYHPNGLLKGFSYGNGIAFNQSLDTERRPDVVNIAGSGLYLDYSYDGNNNVVSINSNDSQYNVNNLSYDGLDRLNSAHGIWGAGSFTYDTLSNLKTQVIGTSNFVYTYNAQNRLDNISGSITKPIAYDTRGNITRNGFQGLTFNAANEMVSGNGATYLYDAYHRLVRKTAGGTSTYSIYDISGTLTSQYKAGTYTDIIKVGRKAIAKKTGSAVTYQHTDVLGSTLAESNSSGSITQKWHYMPFGERKESFSADDTGYTGHQFDTGLGLTYAQARYLDQALGRFISTDPLGFSVTNVQSFNRYAYGNNNPFRYVDPDGLSPKGCGDGSCPSFYDDFTYWSNKSALSASNSLTGQDSGQLLPAHNLAGMLGSSFGRFVALAPLRTAARGNIGPITSPKTTVVGITGKPTKEVLTRKSKGGDGGISQQTIERDEAGNVISRTHRVIANGKTVHQHQNQIGKEGGVRQFPDEWTGTVTINAPYENKPPQFPADKDPGGRY